jgi:hypothetical protein
MHVPCLGNKLTLKVFQPAWLQTIFIPWLSFNHAGDDPWVGQAMTA